MSEDKDIIRGITKRLSESRKLEEAEFDLDNHHYFSAFGKYMKDGKPISRDEYLKASEKWRNSGAPKDSTPDSLGPKFSRPAPKLESKSLKESSPQSLLKSAKEATILYRKIAGIIEESLNGAGYASAYTLSELTPEDIAKRDELNKSAIKTLKSIEVQLKNIQKNRSNIK